MNVETMSFHAPDGASDSGLQKVITVTPTTKAEPVLLNASSLRLWAAMLLGPGLATANNAPAAISASAPLSPCEIHDETAHRLAQRLKKVQPLPGNALSIEAISTVELFFHILYARLHRPWHLSGDGPAAGGMSAEALAATGGLVAGVRSLSDFVAVEEALL